MPFLRRKVAVMCFTDKQFGNIQLFHSRKEESMPPSNHQLKLF